MYYLSVTAQFAAGHAVRGHEGKCARPHGHNWSVEAVVKGRTLDRIGMLVDFAVLKGRLEALLETYDHRDLNQVPPFTTLNPTAENLARHIFDELGRDLPGGVAVDRVTIRETDRCAATYAPDGADPGSPRERDPGEVILQSERTMPGSRSGGVGDPRP